MPQLFLKYKNILNAHLDALTIIEKWFITIERLLFLITS